MKNKKIHYYLKEYSPIIAFVIILLVAIVTKGTTFLNYDNLSNVMLNNAVIGIVALGMTMIIITGGIDLSVGSQLAMTGLVGISVLNATDSILLAIGAAVGLGLLTGFIAGFLVAKFKIPAFIVTLGTTSIFRSLIQYYYHGGGILASTTKLDGFLAISNDKLFGIVPLPIIYWILFALIIAFVMKNTSLGRHIYGVGSNEQATKLSGVNTKRTIILTYVISGVLIAFASMIEASRLGSMNSASSGSSYEMDAIAAVVIGGTSMSGGHGKILGTFFGTLTLGIINNMLNLLGINSFLVGAIKGAIIIAAVLFQKYLESKED
ncbi:ribose transport system permease protein [Breznakia sp. PF5-3]|uniref:ABC transporter permease n=1 Tax=unclassified Breznakia TaxID=2623764 RepID=UPI00240674B3|nr:MULTISPECIES: ABC transporter permease [unclassified Breznakia]MDF9824841.1 ribose transport system permease protein [Breznakia sp. PM6-1]MDF9835197.1 ribose transport system permease protein [Breznakia sp. PF5-3]MDF9837309.1 ribose transport system permease protein [Breznakia sp. PFB2-8]MDF9859767.1 ribose transport system permease protein [Breznakia sp. PH5-24]